MTVLMSIQISCNLVLYAERSLLHVWYFFQGCSDIFALERMRATLD